jgi:hypothetical protein
MKKGKHIKPSVLCLPELKTNRIISSAIVYLKQVFPVD